MNYENENNFLETLIKRISKLPGLGPRSARRIIFYLLKNKELHLRPLIESLIQVEKNIKKCKVCGNLDTEDICKICSDDTRNKQIICVVEDVSDLWALERTNNYDGLYHVLGGVLSAIDGVNPEDLNIKGLVENIKAKGIKEVIIATSATLAGQTTSFYISDLLEGLDVTVSRLAQGIPIGGELDYLDDGTIGAALNSRKIINK